MPRRQKKKGIMDVIKPIKSPLEQIHERIQKKKNEEIREKLNELEKELHLSFHEIATPLNTVNAIISTIRYFNSLAKEHNRREIHEMIDKWGGPNVKRVWYSIISGNFDTLKADRKNIGKFLSSDYVNKKAEEAIKELIQKVEKAKNPEEIGDIIYRDEIWLAKRGLLWSETWEISPELDEKLYEIGSKVRKLRKDYESNRKFKELKFWESFGHSYKEVKSSEIPSKIKELWEIEESASDLDSKRYKTLWAKKWLESFNLASEEIERWWDTRFGKEMLINKAVKFFDTLSESGLYSKKEINDIINKWGGPTIKKIWAATLKGEKLNWERIKNMSSDLNSKEIQELLKKSSKKT